MEDGSYFLRSVGKTVLSKVYALKIPSYLLPLGRRGMVDGKLSRCKRLKNSHCKISVHMFLPMLFSHIVQQSAKIKRYRSGEGEAENVPFSIGGH
ncbi:CLUMA_CG002952, isoform A [Clunio marinus]|uniref:CLUMA_CG002952, isoform A n=1 Tax=Clunio marinus TaxID=568069 RepID=A0A1J1HM96_9DIPT|nr:CLUMA_CG002952, isoform A [Clunio marinus]